VSILIDVRSFYAWWVAKYLRFSLKRLSMQREIHFLENDRWGFKALLLIIGGLLLLLSQLVASIIVDVSYLIVKIESSILLFTLRGTLEILFFCIAISIYIKKILKLDLSFFRIIKPTFTPLWVLVAVIFPFCVILFYLIFLEGEISYGNGYSLAANIVFALKLALVSGITEELLFRGYIMKVIECRWNKVAAIIIPSVVFALLHASKNMHQADFFQLLIAGTLVGVMFSLIVYQRNNIWNAVIVHSMWNFTAIGIFNISAGESSSSIINYKFENEMRLLTGGQFGIEAGMPAIIGYLMVILLTLILIKKGPGRLSNWHSRQQRLVTVGR
jgi:membrane protease YdiL (CAAX protease family)